jgi:hypothetical protein
VEPSIKDVPYSYPDLEISITGLIPNIKQNVYLSQHSLDPELIKERKNYWKKCSYVENLDITEIKM